MPGICPACANPLSPLQRIAGSRVLRCGRCGTESVRHLSDVRVWILFATTWAFIGAIPFAWRTRWVWILMAAMGLFAVLFPLSLPLIRNEPLPLLQQLKKRRLEATLALITAAAGISAALVVGSMRRGA
jgi:hypothetical protein